MTKHYDDLTIEDVMADSMIRRVMRADGVEPRQFESMLRSLASIKDLAIDRPAVASAAMMKGAVRSALSGLPCTW